MGTGGLFAFTCRRKAYEKGRPPSFRGLSVFALLLLCCSTAASRCNGIIPLPIIPLPFSGDKKKCRALGGVRLRKQTKPKRISAGGGEAAAA